MTKRGLRQMSKKAAKTGAVVLALIMVFTMMLPANLAAFADDPVDAGSQALQGLQESPESSAPLKPQEVQDSQDSQEAQALQEPGALEPLEEESPATYTITITPPSNGTVTASAQTASAGSVITLTATGDTGYGLSPGSLKVLTNAQQAPRQVKGNGSDASPYTFNMPADSVTVTAQFVKVSAITVADGIENGTVTTDVTSAAVGETVTITVTPDEGYRLKFNSTTWEMNKSLKATYGPSDSNINIPESMTIPETFTSVDLNIEATNYTFTMPDDDVTITAEFTREFTVRIATDITNGTVASGGKIKAGEGERVGVSALADPTYQLVENSFRVFDSEDFEIVFTWMYGDLIMPASDVTVAAEFVALPKLEGVDFRVVPGDSEVTCSFVTPQANFSGTIYYRAKDSTDAYRSQFVRTGGGTAAGVTYSLAITTGLTNDTEYEFYLQSGAGAVSDMAYATPAAILPTGVSLSRVNADILLGETVQLYATVIPTSSKATEVTWASSNEDVATVGIHGMIETKSLGYTLITATTDVGAKTAVCTVHVVESTETPSGGSMIIGNATAIYNESGGTAEVPFTVIVPTNRPIFEYDFNFNLPAANGRITGISMDGTALDGNDIVEVGNSKIDLWPLPMPANLYDAWGIVTPKEGRFLEAGQEYHFTLTIAIASTAPPVIPINFGNSGNYSATFYYYDYDYSPNRDRFTQAAVRQNGTISATWTGEGVPSAGSGAAKTYYISTADDLLWYAERINAGEVARAMLYRDIDLTGTSFEGIGTSEYPYTSLFSGNGYSVTYNLTQSTDGAIGFVRYVTTGGTVNYLTTRGSLTVTDGTVNAGGIIGELRESGSGGTVNNCTNEVTINVSGSAGGNVGGIVGYAEFAATSWSASVSNSTNLGTITANGTGVVAVGGVVGYVKNGNVSGNGNGGTRGAASGVDGKGTVTGRGAVGGIVGIVENTTGTKDIANNTNFALITGLSGEATGGIAGKAHNASIGGTGSWTTPTEYANRNYGVVTGATTYVAGIIASLDDTGTEWVYLNYNTGQLTSTSTTAGSAIGGIVGHITGSETVVIAKNTSKGTIVAGSAVVRGGVLGKADAALSEALCTENYYAQENGLLDAVFGIAAPASWLSIDGYAPQYSGTGGDGSAADPYQIASLSDFLWFTKQMNSGTELNNSPGKDYCVILVTDIDLSDYPGFEGIGTDFYPSQSYHGTFDGNGHTITIAFDGSTTLGSAGIFRRCAGATIKNLTIVGSAKGSTAVGLAILFEGGTIENVHNEADLEASNYAAGIMYRGSVEVMRNVTNSGTITAGQAAAGIALNLVGGALIEDCHNYGDITGGQLAAGIVGSFDAGAKSADGDPSFIFRNVSNSGTVESKASVIIDLDWSHNADPSPGHSAGGIIGNFSNSIVSIENAVNNGTVMSSGNNAGGIVGAINSGDYQSTDLRVINSTNNGTIMSTYDGDDPLYLTHISIGGIVGNLAGAFDPVGWWPDPLGAPGGGGKATLTGNTNNGTIIGPEGASNVGAIVGLVTGNSDTTKINNNYTTVEIDDSGRYASDGSYYNPDTHEVINGQIVEKQSPNNNPDNTTNNNNQNTPNTPGSAFVVDSSTSVVVADETAPSTILPADGAATTPVQPPTAPNTTPIDPADTPTTDNPVPAPARTPTFFEIVVETVQNNPVIVVLVIVAAGVLAMLGGLWRYRKTRRE